MSKFISVFILLFAFVGSSANLNAQSGKLIKAEKKPSAKTGKHYTVAKKATTEDAKKVSPSKNGTAKKSNEVPEGFPKYVNTGNPEVDQQNYAKAKDKWYAENPDKATKLNHTSTSGKQKVSKTRFNSLNETQKKEILSRPDLYIIE